MSTEEQAMRCTVWLSGPQHVPFSNYLRPLAAQSASIIRDEDGRQLILGLPAEFHPVTELRVRQAIWTSKLAFLPDKIAPSISEEMDELATADVCMLTYNPHPELPEHRNYSEFRALEHFRASGRVPPIPVVLLVNVALCNRRSEVMPRLIRFLEKAQESEWLEINAVLRAATTSVEQIVRAWLVCTQLAAGERNGPNDFSAEIEAGG